MDLTPQVLRDVEFREKLRGYHPDDVDDFLEEVAVAVDGLLTRLRISEAGGAPLMPPPVAPVAPVVTAAADPNLNESTLSRAILLAQRTADLAVSEAEQSARKIVDEARAEADRILSETQAKVAAMTEEARSTAEASVAELDQRRAGLEREVAALQGWAAQHRDRLRDVLSDQLRSLDIWLATSAVPRPQTRLAPAGGGADQTGPAGMASAVPPPAAPPLAAAAPAPVPPAAAAVPPLAYRPPGDDGMAAYAGPGSPEVLPTVESTGTVDVDLSATEGEDLLRRAAADAPPPAEPVDAGAALTSTGGGGDGVVLFDQDGQAIEGLGGDGARIAGRYFRQR